MKKYFISASAFLLILLFGLFLCAKNVSASSGWATSTPTGCTFTILNTVSTISNYVYLGTDNGICKTTDGGVSWSPVNAGLPANSNVTSLAIGWNINQSDGQYNATSTSYVFAGTSNNGIFRSTIGSSAWTATNSGLTDIHISSIETDQYQASGGIFNNIYIGTPSGVFRSINAGVSWTTENNGLLADTNIVKLASDFGDMYGSANGKIYALSNSNKLYVSDLFSSSGTNENWSKVFDSTGTTTIDISMLNSTGKLIWLATNKGIMESDENGQSLTYKNIGLATSTAFLKSVATDYLNRNIAYLATSDNGVYRTTDEAASIATSTPDWLPVNKNLTEKNIKKIVTNPTDSKTIYAVSDHELYKLSLGSDTALDDLTPPGPITDLTMTNNTHEQIILSWTEPGLDEFYGDEEAGSYFDVRYSTSSPITENNWANATIMDGPGKESPYHLGDTRTFYFKNPSCDYYSCYFAIKTVDGSGNQSALSNVIAIVDDVKPTINSFSVPSSYGSLINVPVTFSASDNYAVSGYMVNESSSTPTISSPDWTPTATTTYTFSTPGAKTLYAWAKDPSNNISSSTTNTTVSIDTTVPIVNSFVIPSTYSSLNLPITTFTASDNASVSQYLITESATTPAGDNPDWSFSKPTIYVMSSYISHTLYAWVKDSTGNISAVGNNTHDTTAYLNGSDNGDIIVDNLNATQSPAGSWSTSTFAPGYYGNNYAHDGNAGKGVRSIKFNPNITQAGDYNIYIWLPPTPAYPAATNTPIDIRHNSATTTIIYNEQVGDGQWNLVGNYHFAGTGNEFVQIRNDGTYVNSTTGYVYADAFRFEKIDLTIPTISSFTIPTTSSSLTVPVTIIANDDIGVTGYLISESDTTPDPTFGQEGQTQWCDGEDTEYCQNDSVSWTADVPTSFTFHTAGSKTLYLWVKDASMNLSTKANASVIISSSSPCTSFTYTPYSTCSAGSQTRTILTSSPSGCTGGSPVLTQACYSGGGGGGGAPSLIPCTLITYSPWTLCTATSTIQSRTVLSKTPTNCSTVATTTQACGLATSTSPLATTTLTTSAPLFLFTHILNPYTTDSDVKQLQIFLNTHGFIIAPTGTSSPTHETTYFNDATRLALIRFQNAHYTDILKPAGVTKGTGVFGLGSIKYVNGVLKQEAPSAPAPAPTFTICQFITLLQTVGIITTERATTVRGMFGCQ